MKILILDVNPDPKNEPFEKYLTDLSEELDTLDNWDMQPLRSLKTTPPTMFLKLISYLDTLFPQLHALCLTSAPTSTRE